MATKTVETKSEKKNTPAAENTPPSGEGLTTEEAAAKTRTAKAAKETPRQKLDRLKEPGAMDNRDAVLSTVVEILNELVD
jgi:hypothetical protein